MNLKEIQLTKGPPNMMRTDIDDFKESCRDQTINCFDEKVSSNQP